MPRIVDHTSSSSFEANLCACSGDTVFWSREEGWAFDQCGQDIWTRKANNKGQHQVLNNVNGLVHEETPEQFRGGLLTSDMGLGKALSMICLIAANQSPKEPLSPPITPDSVGQRSYVQTNATLLIVPPSLLQGWAKQLGMHLENNSLKWCIFHGQGKKELDDLKEYDIVITTFHTVSGIWWKEGAELENTRYVVMSLSLMNHNLHIYCNLQIGHAKLSM